LAEQSIRVAIAGASGYTGGELARLLLDHPTVELTFLSSQRHAGVPVGTLHPALRNHPRAGGLTFRSLDELPEADVAFACLPTGALPARLSMLAERAKRVLTLAGDYRLADPAEIHTHYPATAKHPPPESAQFHYIVPELISPLPDSRFVNLPGCMAVASVYALYPVVRHDLAEPSIVVDAKTGSTGGGRNSAEQHAEREGNVRVHKLHGHRHGPEIRQALADLAGAAPDLQFSTHSLDVPRGILVTAYARLRPGVTSLQVKRAYAQAYIGTPFVRVRPAPKTPQDFPMLKAVVGSNVAEVAIAVRSDRLVAVTALDNLVKGAAGQAIQVMNLLHGLPETMGLPMTAATP
jgi:N-acetyl-gamma-glutamyl-phosphate reductase